MKLNKDSPILKQLYETFDLKFKLLDYDTHKLVGEYKGFAEFPDSEQVTLLVPAVGIEDKNHKLIYKGDVLLFGNAHTHFWVYLVTSLPGNPLITHLVELYNNYTQGKDGMIHTYELQYPPEADIKSLEFLQFHNDQCFVLGNIYDNPEILDLNNEILKKVITLANGNKNTHKPNK